MEQNGIKSMSYRAIIIKQKKIIINKYIQHSILRFENTIFPM